MNLKVYKKIQKLLGNLTPDEVQELVDDLKGEDTDKEAMPQNDLKQEAKEVVDSKEDGKKDNPTPQSVGEAPKAEESKSQEKGTNEEDTHSAHQEDSSLETGAEDGVVNEEVQSEEPDFRDINDFVTKEELKAYMANMEAKYNAEVDKSKKLQEELDNAKTETQGLKDKYEKDSFGDFFAEFDSKEKPQQKNSESFDDFYEQNFK